MSLTIEEMDEINVLLTEVSLELLGNQFYDIHGQAHASLRELYLPNVELKIDYEPDQSDLMRELMKEVVAEVSSSSKVSPKVVAKEARINKKPSQIHGRRNSYAPRDPKPKHSENTRTYFNKRRVSSETPLSMKEKSTFGSGKPATGAAAPPTDLVETDIKNNVAKELVRKLDTSKKLRIKYFQANQHRMATDYLDEYEIVNEFHANEKSNLMSDSSALIELIKYIKCDPANAHKIGTIAANILHVKDLI